MVRPHFSFLQFIPNLYTKWQQKMLVGFWIPFDCHSQHTLLNTQSIESLAPVVKTVTSLSHTFRNFCSQDWAASHVDQLSKLTDGSCEPTDQIALQYT